MASSQVPFTSHSIFFLPLLLLFTTVTIITTPMIITIHQGPRVLTAGNMMVRRDKRLKLNGNNLVISQLEVAITSS